jgi:hypothetical protein
MRGTCYELTFVNAVPLPEKLVGDASRGICGRVVQYKDPTTYFCRFAYPAGESSKAETEKSQGSEG